MKQINLNVPPTLEAMPFDVRALREEVRQLRAELAARGQITPPQKPVTTKQLCEFLGVTEQCLIKWRKKQIVPYYRLGSKILYDLQKVITNLEKNSKK